MAMDKQCISNVTYISEDNLVVYHVAGYFHACNMMWIVHLGFDFFEAYF